MFSKQTCCAIFLPTESPESFMGNFLQLISRENAFKRTKRKPFYVGKKQHNPLNSNFYVRKRKRFSEVRREKNPFHVSKYLDKHRLEKENPNFEDSRGRKGMRKTSSSQK